MVNFKECKILYLTGGLGNQLFQIAAALNVWGNKVIEIEWTLGSPRLNGNFPEIASFNLPDNLKIHKSQNKKNIVASKYFGFVLRNGFNPKKFENFFLPLKLRKIVSRIIFRLRYKKHFRIISGSDIGYTPITEQEENEFLIGYFQSYIYLKDNYVQKVLMNMSPKNLSQEEREYLDIAKNSQFIMIHVRLGDYLTADEFGIPSSEYYLKALGDLKSKYPNSEVWLFSNDLAECSRRFPELFKFKIDVLIPQNFSTAATFEIMRYGSGYILANSTFSWWAAALSRISNASVIAPDPWFSNLVDPKELIPPYWTKMPSVFSTLS